VSAAACQQFPAIEAAVDARIDRAVAWGQGPQGAEQEGGRRQLVGGGARPQLGGQDPAALGPGC
jgi:hypothetical protein